jgi:hypothetical protein
MVVNRLDCSKSTLGDNLVPSQPQGKFCLVELTVANVVGSPQPFSGNAQKAFDAKGTELADNPEAEIYANDDSQTFLSDIKPGKKVRGKLVFDVAPATTLTRIELHDSFTSAGVQVTLK